MRQLTKSGDLVQVTLCCELAELWCGGLQPCVPGLSKHGWQSQEGPQLGWVQWLN